MISEYFASVGINVDNKELAKVDKFLSGVEARLDKFRNTTNIFSGGKDSKRGGSRLRTFNSGIADKYKQEVKGSKALTKESKALSKETKALVKDNRELNKERGKALQNKLAEQRVNKALKSRRKINPSSNRRAFFDKTRLIENSQRFRKSGMSASSALRLAERSSLAKGTAVVKDVVAKAVKPTTRSLVKGVATRNLGWLPKDGTALPKTRYSGIFKPESEQTATPLTPKQQQANRSKFFQRANLLGEASRFTRQGVSSERAISLAERLMSKRAAEAAVVSKVAAKGGSRVPLKKGSSAATRKFFNNKSDPNRVIPVNRATGGYLGTSNRVLDAPMGAIKGVSNVAFKNAATEAKTTSEVAKRLKHYNALHRVISTTNTSTVKQLDEAKAHNRELRKQIASQKELNKLKRQGERGLGGVAGDRLRGSNLMSGGRGGRGGFGLGLPMGGGFLASAGGFYGLNRLNKANQEAMIAPLTTQAVFSSVGKAPEEGTESWEWFKDLGDKMGYDYMSTAPSFNSFMSNSLGAGITTEGSQDLFKGMTEYQTAMGLDPYRRKLVFNALSQMAGKQKVMS